MSQLYSNSRSNNIRFKFRIVEDSLFVLLDKDLEASVNELLGGGRSKGRAALELLFFAAQPENGLVGHCEARRR